MLVLLVMVGCQTAAHKSRSLQRQEDLRALKSVASGIANKDLSDEEFRNLARQLRDDQQAQSAVNAITSSMTSDAVEVYYCPIDGKRFSGRVKICPEHHAELKLVNE